MTSPPIETRLTSAGRSVAPALPVGLLLLGLLAADAAAVKPKQWMQKTEADFAKAELDKTVVTNYGRIELSRATEARSTLAQQQTVIHDIVRFGKGLCLAVGPKGWLMAADTDGRNARVVQEYAGRQVFALAVGPQGLWVAVSGEEKSQLELRDADLKARRTVDLPGVRYVWDLLIHGKTAYLATGTEGRVLAVALDRDKPQPQVLLDSQQDNVLCLGRDGQGRIYAGTDGEGLVYRLTPAGDGQWHDYVLYDANEPEIGALLVEPDGTVYVGTADAEQAKPGRKMPPAEQDQGKPEPEPAPSDKPTSTQPSGPPPTDSPGQKPAGQAGASSQDEKTPDRPEDQGGDDPSDDPATPAAPTARQYDRLRQEIRKRLDQARKAGTLSVKPSAGSSSGKPRVSRAGKSEPTTASDEQGNAVYRIDSSGFVREIFRESVMILRLVRQDGRLLIATGNQGQLYQVELADGQTSVLADLEAEQIPAMLALPDGTLMLGTAHAAALVHVNGRFARSGTFTSDVLDAEQISLWGKLQVMADVPAPAGLAVQTRSGNVSDPQAGSWSAWSSPQPVAPEHFGDPVYLEVASPPARFLQYRLTLRGDGQVSPSVDRVALKYLMPNLQPRITKLTAEYDKPDRDDKQAGPAALTRMKIEWEAQDPNQDQLTYRLEVRPAGRKDLPWLTLAEDLKETEYEWNTRHSPDGRYEIRLTASDRADNMPDQALQARRISAVVTVDNTAPTISALRLEAGPEPGQVRLSAEVSDALTDIAEVRYLVNGEKDWKPVLPADRIYDSTSERVSFTIPDLSPGPVVVTVRALDSQNNAAYASRAVTVPAGK